MEVQKEGTPHLKKKVYSDKIREIWGRKTMLICSTRFKCDVTRSLAQLLKSQVKLKYFNPRMLLAL